MTPAAPIASIPSAILRPLAKDYRFPLWRWLVLPAVTYMAWRTGGTWLTGQLDLFPDTLRFTPSTPARAKTRPEPLLIPLAGMEVELRKAMASERLVLTREGEPITFLLVRGETFVSSLRETIGSRVSPAEIP